MGCIFSWFRRSGQQQLENVQEEAPKVYSWWVLRCIVNTSAGQDCNNILRLGGSTNLLWTANLHLDIKYTTALAVFCFTCRLCKIILQLTMAGRFWTLPIPVPRSVITTFTQKERKSERKIIFGVNSSRAELTNWLLPSVMSTNIIMCLSQYMNARGLHYSYTRSKLNQECTK